MLLQAAVVCLLVAIVVWYLRFRRSRYCQLLARIPGPAGLPLVGNLRDAIRNTDKLIEYSENLRQKYGSTFVLWLGPAPLVFLTEPRDVEIVLNKSAALSKPPIYKVLELGLGYCLITADRRGWKRFHKIIAPAFGTPVLKSFLPTFNDKSKVLVDMLGCHADGRRFDILDYMMMCTLDMVTQTSLGTNMNVLQDKRMDLVDSLRVTEDVMYHTAFLPWCWIPVLMKTTSSYRAGVKGIKVLLDYADNIIAQKLISGYDLHDKKSCGEYFGESFNEEKGCQGFLDRLTYCMKNGSTSLKSVEIKDNTMTLMIGGMDTGSIAISAAMMLLGLHQDVQKRVMKELAQIFKDDLYRDVTFEDLLQMTYMEQVINETLRLYPPAPITARIVEEEINVTEYTLPTGTCIAIPITLIHRDPKYYPDPDKFDPERFSAENSAKRHPYSFIPFLGGRRMCIGKKYAYMQMKILLSTLLRHYEVLPCASREEMEQRKFRITLHLVHGCKVKLVPRKK